MPKRFRREVLQMQSLPLLQVHSYDSWPGTETPNVNEMWAHLYEVLR
jgi:hypothetical protein